MKKILFLSSLLFTAFLHAQTPCQNGFAGSFPCEGYDLLDSLSLNDLDADAGNDSWGWTDPETGVEYALIGLNNGTAFIDISNPTNVIFVGKLPTHTTNSAWRDVKVYGNYAFIVSEASGHGMQVFDLTRLRDVNLSIAPVIFAEDAHYDEFGNAHNIVINPKSAFAYAVGTTTFAGGPHFVDISDPLNPTFAGGYSDNAYSHDAQVITYNGPDGDYSGSEIFIGSNEDEIAIVDITDKNNPSEIATISYSNLGFTHQGWFTEDQRFFLLGDELDELNFGFNTRTLVFDFEDLDNPQFHFEYEGSNPSIDHNGYVLGDLYFLANYTSGVRVIDISDIANGNMEEIGFFDTVPNSNTTNFSGLWNVYPYFESGNIVLSDINSGFFLVGDASVLSTDTITLENSLSITPNPVNQRFVLQQPEGLIGNFKIVNILGQVVLNGSAQAKSLQIDISHLPQGLYVLTTATQTVKLIKS